ncbi:MAG: c-type cytochrome biogenesis protein CcmI [Gallionellaceae bacterium]|jgi:cytochrome c-type biogenesis protein CcmH|nr:c-type cytochrome biogenesis protein CcmI [Gallionellaceae bacterium]
MTTFLIFCALLLVVALLFVVLPLWRNRVKNNSVVRDAANLEIFRDQIAEMDADLRNGLLTQESYEQGKRELQARLLDEVKETEAAAPVSRSHKALMIAVIVLMPVVAGVIYWNVPRMHLFDASGNSIMDPDDKEKLASFKPSVFWQRNSGGAQDDAANPMSSNPQIEALEQRVEKNPQDPDSLLALARAYMQAGAYQQSANVYNKLTQLIPNEAALWADYADMLAMAGGQVLAGHPTMFINKALALDPNNIKANAMAGAAAMERHDYAAAVKYWEKLQPMVGAEDAEWVGAALQEARAGLARGDKPIDVQPGIPMEGNVGAPMAGAGGGAMGGGEAPAPAASSGKERITGTVTLSDALKSRVGAGDMLFVVAVAESGPPMPLAVMRGQASDLPLKFTLDDSMSMMPQMRLSNFDRVVVKARITKSGEPTAQPGDLQGVSATLKPGTSGVNLVIDTVVK